MANSAEMRTVLGSQTNDKSVAAQAVLKLIQTAISNEEKVELLAVALRERDSVTKTGKALPNKGITPDTWDTLIRTNAAMVDGFQKMAFFRSRTAEDFAAEILKLLDFFSEENERTVALAVTLWSEYVPFQELPGAPVHMSTAEYQHKLASEDKKTRLIDYIIGLPFDERTETASMILQVIDDSVDKDLRVALLSHAFYKHERKIVAYVKGGGS
jgi:hypothetical protein